MSQTINAYLYETLDGVPEDLGAFVLEAVAQLSDEAQVSGPVLSYSEKMDSLRYAYTSLVNYLIEHRLTDLTPGQRVFINTGALADQAEFENEQGHIFQVELLPTPVYEKLRTAILDLSELKLPSWSHVIYRAEDQFNAIALGALEPVGLDKKNLAKFRATRSLEQAALSFEQSALLNNTYDALQAQSQALYQEVNSLLNSYYQEVRRIPDLQRMLLQAQGYTALVSERNPTLEQKEELKRSVVDNSARLGQEIRHYADRVATIMEQVREHAAHIDLRNQKLREVTGKLIHSGVQEMGSVRNRSDLVFDEETLRLIKANINSISNFAVSQARNSPQRIPESTSRILLTAHTRSEDPVDDSYCTVQNVIRAFEKVLAIHTNLFDYDEAEQPIIPPVIIEPIRNYVEWADERFILGFVSGEIGRNGQKYSFSPVDLAVLRACGQYAFRERVFDYRGNRLEGNLMADYSARMESKTAVRWTGEEKKFRMVTVWQEMDAASRSEAVDDYIELLFHAVNDFPAPLHISRRKLAVMLRYICIENPVKTVALLLRYVADREPEEARDTLLYLAEHNREKARQLIVQGVDLYRNILNERPEHYILQILGGLT
jgi:hypothetical protein